MIKQINRILKLVGFNLVRAKRRKGVRWHGRLAVSTCEDPTPLLLAVTEVADPKSFSVGPNPGEVPLSKYQDDYKWKNIPDNPSCAVGKSVPCTTVPNPGQTHYVGDDCPGGHLDEFPGYEAKKHVVNPDAAFVPVDIDQQPK